MLHVKKNDTVKILVGKDKGKTGKVLRLDLAKGRAIVQGVNFVKRHVKKRKQEDQANIIKQEAAMDISNLGIVCKRCDRTVRVGFDVLADGSKVRFCKKCKEVL
jgi:large subunit ribosomal protein L24